MMERYLMMIFCNRNLGNLEVNKDQGDGVSVCLETTYLAKIEDFLLKVLQIKLKVKK